MDSLKIFNFNASRISSLQRIRAIKSIFEAFNADVISIQEIDIKSSVIVFGASYHVFVNLENEAKDSIGIVTLVRKTIRVKESHGTSSSTFEIDPRLIIVLIMETF